MYLNTWMIHTYAYAHMQLYLCVYIYTQIHRRYTHTIHLNIGILNQRYIYANDVYLKGYTLWFALAATLRMPVVEHDKR